MGEFFTTLLLSLLAGAMLFISPCCIPLYPSYLAHLTGMSVTAIRAGKKTRAVSTQLLAHGLCFVIGVSIVFYIMGFAAGAIGSFLTTFWFSYQSGLRILGGVIVILMGMIMTGILRPPTWLSRLQSKGFAGRQVGYISSFLMGLGFAAGWMPCTVPFMGSMFAFIVQQPEYAFACMTAFSLGFGIPFLLGAFFLSLVRGIARYAEFFMRAGGIVMILCGILLLTNKLSILIPDSWFNF